MFAPSDLSHMQRKMQLESRFKEITRSVKSRIYTVIIID